MSGDSPRDLAVADAAQPTAAVRRPASPLRGPSAWNGSGSARPSRQSATYSRERRAVLEAVAGAAAEQPPRRVLGMAVEDEVRVRRQVVLADAPADDRRAGERREAVRGVVARDLLELARAAAGRACRDRRSRRAGRARSSRRARRSRRGRRTARRTRRSRACRATTRRCRRRRRRGARSSARPAPGKNCGSHEPHAQTTTSAARGVGRRAAAVLEPHAAALAVLDEELRRAPRVHDARLRLEAARRAGRRSSSEG